MSERCATTADVYDAAACALTIYQHTVVTLIPTGTPEEIENAVVGVEDWMQREARLEEWEESLAEMDSRMQVEFAPGTELDADTSDGLSEGDMRQEDVELRVLKNERDNLARKLEMEKSAIRDALGAARPLARSYRYDEWDYSSRSYLRHWCRLFEEPLATGADGSDIQELKQIIKRHAPGVLKRFEQIKPLGFQRVSRVVDGDELDLNALIQARQDVRAGKTPDERVYSRRERVHRDVCAVFLVDLSASTDDPIDPPEPVNAPADSNEVYNLRDPYEDVMNIDHALEPDLPARRIIDLQRESMVVMATALEHLGDSYGIYGFSGYGRDCVEFFVAKEPDEAFTPATLDAIANMTPKRSTRMGPAIRHATSKLMSSGHAMKLLIVLSDGFPQDCDYGPERGDHHYGLMDTAKSLEEAQNKGVETFCVTVDKSGHDYLKKMCVDSRYLVIDEIEDLPEALSKVYQTLAGR
jgi:nitric oxide reductase activation protein